MKETNQNPLTDGIFNRLFTNYGSYFTWLTQTDAHTLDMTYYFNHSGDRTIAPMFEKLLDLEESGSIASALNLIAETIKLMFGDNWNRLYKAYIQEQYKPLENYSMIESEQIGSKITTSRSVNNETYGFNSTDPTPTDNGSESSTSEGSKDDNQRDLTRSGNIGVTTSQQMLQSEIDLRKWIFYDNIMIDIDKILTLSIYE